MGGAGCSAGRFRIHSAMASFMRGASAGHKNSGRGYGQEKTRLELDLPLGIMSQVRQVLRAGLVSLLPGHQQRALRQVEGVDPLSCLHRQPEASSSRLLGCVPLCLYRKSGSAVPPFECQAHFLGNRSLPVHVGIPWDQLGLLGTGLFCSFSSSWSPMGHTG